MVASSEVEARWLSSALRRDVERNGRKLHGDDQPPPLVSTLLMSRSSLHLSTTLQLQSVIMLHKRTSPAYREDSRLLYRKSSR